jgi:hypothetical protein
MLTLAVSPRVSCARLRKLLAVGVVVGEGVCVGVGVGVRDTLGDSEVDFEALADLRGAALKVKECVARALALALALGVEEMEGPGDSEAVKEGVEVPVGERVPPWGREGEAEVLSVALGEGGGVGVAALEREPEGEGCGVLDSVSVAVAVGVVVTVGLPVPAPPPPPPRAPRMDGVPVVVPVFEAVEVEVREEATLGVEVAEEE